MKYLSLPAVIIAFMGCSGGASTPAETSETVTGADTIQPLTEVTFRDFLKKFKTVKLPFRWGAHGEEVESGGNIEAPFKKFAQDEFSLYYVMLEDTSKFFSVITLSVGDDFVPVLTTYDKSGKIIDSERIVGPGCGGDVCVTCYPSHSVIGKDLSIHAVDSILFRSCDQQGNEIPGNDTLLRNLMDGKLNPDGTIEMSPIRRIKEKATLARLIGKD